MEIFLSCVHTIMFTILAFAFRFTEIRSAGKELFNNEKHSDDKKEYYLGEKIMLIIIIFAVVISLAFIVFYVAKRNTIVAVWFCAVAGIAYVYIAVKQIVKMLLMPEKRGFSNADIDGFMNTYLGWWIIVLVVSALKTGGGITEKIMPIYREDIMVGMFFVWCYFNILFIVGGLYIFLCFSLKFVKYLVSKFNFMFNKIESIVNRIFDLEQKGEKYDGLRSYRLWKENNEKSVKYKCGMTIPMFMLDICSITLSFLKYLLKLMFCSIFKFIYETITVLYKCAKKLWSKYKNNEWMYLLAQMAGVCSCVIVFLKLQYGEYEEVTRKVYEFLGIVILLPYFTNKIVGMNKQ